MSNKWQEAMQQGEAEKLNDAQAKPKKEGLADRASAGLGRLLSMKRSEAKERRAGVKAALKQQGVTDKELARDLKPGKSSKAALESKISLKMEATIGNVVFTDTDTWCWFSVMPTSHGFSPIKDIEEAIREDAKAYAKLVGRRLHVRSTTRPYPVASWAKDTYDDAVAANGYRIPEGYGDFLTRSQTHMQGSNFSEKWVHLGVKISSFRRFKDPKREYRHHRETIDDMARVLGASSLNAVEATNEDMEWLIRRSIALGVNLPRIGVVADYTEDDIPSLEDAAVWTADPLTKYLTVSAMPEGVTTEIERKVSVLTLSRLGDMTFPEETQSGWMQRTDRLNFPVEWSAFIDVIPEEKTKSWLRGRLDLIEDQVKHYREDHAIKPPKSLLRQDAMAMQIQEQIDSDHGGLAVRTIGWYRVAVSGANEEELNQRVQALRKAYGTRAEFAQTRNQYHHAREFIPGEPLATPAYQRRMSTAMLAAAVPHGTAEIGDRTGIHMGYTAGTAIRSVAWHTHWDMERRDVSGLMMILGGLGSGKTFALGGITYGAVMNGVRANVLDPSDRLGRLCDPAYVPELEGKARYVNLMKGRNGELNPYRVVADPRKEHFMKDGEFQEEEYLREVSFAEGTRGSLMNDVLRSFLSKNNQTSDEVETVLSRAMSEVQPVRTASPTRILIALEEIADAKIHTDLQQEHRIKARDLVNEYSRLAKTSIGKLIFPDPDAAPLADDDDDDMLLTVYTLNGMSIPSAEVIASGNIPESARMAMAVMTLAAWLVQSRIYMGDINERKLLAIDEGKVLNQIDSGRNLLTKSATDSRKFNLRALYAAQNATHFDLDGDSEDSLGNLVGAALVGDTQEATAQKAALKILGAPTDVGYEGILGQLRPRSKKRGERVHRDADGKIIGRSAVEDTNKKRHFIFSVRDDTAVGNQRRIERIVYDLDAHPHVMKALASAPAPYDRTAGLKEPKEEAEIGGHDENVA